MAGPHGDIRGTENVRRPEGGRRRAHRLCILIECTSVLWDSGARWKLEDGSTGDGPEMSMAWLDS